jgi:MFS transporter, ACS family, hexuronate transporter
MKRWVPTVSMLLVSLISYIDRNTLALLAPTILRETGLSAQAYGWIISAFSVAYMIGNPVWGRILDRVGTRRGMTAAVGLWSLASAAHAFTGGFWGLASARAVLGFGEGATFPGGLRTAVLTLPAEKRSRGTAVSYSGGSLGAVITPLIVTPIALRFGWRGAFWFTGLIGALWLLVGRPVLPEARAVTRIEAEPARSPEWLDARVWAFIALYALGCLPIGFVIYSAALYLGAALGKTQGEIGHLLWIPPLGWEIGYFFWGWVTDRYAEHGASRVGLRRVLTAMALLTLPLVATHAVRSAPGALALMFLAMFAGGGFIIASMAYATSVFPARDAGLIAGIGAGAYSAAVAVAMPMFGALLDARGYHTAFAVAGLAPVAGVALWWVLSRAGLASR